MATVGVAAAAAARKGAFLATARDSWLPLSHRVRHDVDLARRKRENRRVPPARGVLHYKQRSVHEGPLDGIPFFVDILCCIMSINCCMYVCSIPKFSDGHERIAQSSIYCFLRYVCLVGDAFFLFLHYPSNHYVRYGNILS